MKINRVPESRTCPYRERLFVKAGKKMEGKGGNTGKLVSEKTFSPRALQRQGWREGGGYRAVWINT